MKSSEFSDFDQERLEAFKASITRSRWLLLTTTLIGSLMLLHLCVGEYGYQTQQLKTALKRRLVNAPALFLARDENAAMRADASSLLRLGPDSLLINAVQEYISTGESADADTAVAIAVARLSMNQLINDIAPRDGRLPLLGVEAPANDYLAVMTWMLLVFATALWLNIRSLEATWRSIAGESRLVEIAKLHVTFTGLRDHTNGARVAHFLQYAAVWLPVVVFLPIVILDLVPQMMLVGRNKAFVLGDGFYIVMRIALFTLAVGWLTVLAISNSRRLRRLDQMAYGVAPPDKGEAGTTLSATGVIRARE
jgi:hypothetical protein